MKFYKILIILLYNYPKMKPIVVPQTFFLKVKEWLIVGSQSPIFPYFSMKFFLKKEGGDSIYEGIMTMGFTVFFMKNK